MQYKYFYTKRTAAKIRSFYRNVGKKYRHTYSYEDMERNVRDAFFAIYARVIKNNLEGSKGEIANDFPKGGELEIVSLTATKLVLHDDTDETMSFAKVQ